METKELELLGKKVKVKKLSVGDMFKMNEVAESDEATQMFTIVSLALVEPKMTVEEVYNLDSKYINDIVKIVDIATNEE